MPTIDQMHYEMEQVKFQWPDRIYATPDEWGNETYYVSAAAIDEMIVSLRELGDDWADIGLSDCAEWQRVDFASTFAIYEECGVRNPEQWHFTANGNGYFARGEQAEQD